MIEPAGHDRELATREHAVDLSEDHGHHEHDPHEQAPSRFTDHTLALITATGTVILVLGTVVLVLIAVLR